MGDKLGLRNISTPLQHRYDKFILWHNEKNYTSDDIVAAELELKVSEVDVFLELGDLDDDEFSIIDEKGFDIGLLFLIVRSPRRTRDIIYGVAEEILSAKQPLSRLKEIVDHNSEYLSIETLVKKISGDCWLSISKCLKQRNINSGTITPRIRNMLFNAGKRLSKGEELTSKMVDWIVRALNHDHANDLGVFLNETVEMEFHDDYMLFMEIMENLASYENYE